jgi:Ca2+-binding RTX toxin-like protein
MRGSRALLFGSTLLLAAALGGSALAQDSSRCGPPRAGEQCGEGNGRHTPGGNGSVSHAGWPAITGILWVVRDSAGHHRVGTSDNDELLGHHGSDRISGGPGNDVIWGDWEAAGNDTWQVDVLRGGAGNDFIYPSHGTTTVLAGPGNDHIRAYYGHGTIDCGPGYDTAQVRENGAFKLRNCEVVHHFCQHGSDKNGNCKKAGAASARRRR